MVSYIVLTNFFHDYLFDGPDCIPWKKINILKVINKKFVFCIVEKFKHPEEVTFSGGRGRGRGKCCFQQAPKIFQVDKLQ